MKIHVLGTDTVNQIAAGEVIERPSSIVKELVENAIDAHASQVTVEIRGGGIEYLRVSDNGDGIAEDDLKNAFLPHATSKIRSLSDLESIMSFGFRGEALSSIAAVSDVELITKTKEDFFSHRILVKGGEIGKVEEVAGVDGSTFIIRNLFYNVPARKKFLYSESTESNRVEDIVEKLALANHQVSFHFIRDGKTRFQSLGSSRIQDIVYSIYGKEQSKESLPLEGAYYPSSITGMPTVHIRGLLGRPNVTRANRQFELFFVNGRYVHDALLSRALEDAYKPFLMQHKFPFAILFLDITPSLMDVNVHPQKLEVRFQNREQIYQAVFNAVNVALSHANLIDQNPLSPFLQEEKAEKKIGIPKREGNREEESVVPLTEHSLRKLSEERRTVYSEFDLTKSLEKHSLSEEQQSLAEPGVPFDAPKTEKQTEWNSISETGIDGERTEEKTIQREAERERISGKAEALFQSEPEQESLFSAPFLSEEARKSHRIIGEIFRTYWLIEYEESLYIMDQHAAHEKVNFERMMKRKREKKQMSQNILPLSIHLQNKEKEILFTYSGTFQEMGYQWDEEAGGVSLTAIPVDFPSVDKEEVFLEILDGLSEDSEQLSGESLYNKIASMSCKAAIKGNQQISFQECDALLDELLQLENPFACPHGRPTIIAFRKQDLEKMFKRIV